MENCFSCSSFVRKMIHQWVSQMPDSMPLFDFSLVEHTFPERQTKKQLWKRAEALELPDCTCTTGGSITPGAKTNPSENVSLVWTCLCLQTSKCWVWMLIQVCTEKKKNRKAIVCICLYASLVPLCPSYSYSSLDVQHRWAEFHWPAPMSIKHAGTTKRKTHEREKMEPSHLLKFLKQIKGSIVLLKRLNHFRTATCETAHPHSKNRKPIPKSGDKEEEKL